MIDWDNAPEGATHYRSRTGLFYKVDMTRRCVSCHTEDMGWYDSFYDVSDVTGVLFTPRPTAPTPHTMTPTHIEISTGKEWEMVYQSSESCMLTDRNGSAYSLVARDLSQYFTPIGGDTREMTERERFDAVMGRSDWSGFDKDQRGVLWEMWKEALGM